MSPLPLFFLFFFLIHGSHLRAYFLLSFLRFQFVQFHSWMEMCVLWDPPLCLIEWRNHLSEKTVNQSQARLLRELWRWVKGPCRDKHNVLAGLVSLSLSFFFFLQNVRYISEDCWRKESVKSAGAESAGLLDKTLDWLWKLQRSPSALGCCSYKTPNWEIVAICCHQLSAATQQVQNLVLSKILWGNQIKPSWENNKRNANTPCCKLKHNTIL